jgi:hypothetical protein
MMAANAGNQPGAGGADQLIDGAADNPQPIVPFPPKNRDRAIQAEARGSATESADVLPLDRYLSRDLQKALAIVVALWWLAMIVYLLSGVGATFSKAGKPAWGAFVPLYNVVLLFDIADLSLWWAVLILVPFVNFLVVLLLAIKIAENFGRSAAFGVGLAFLGPIFYPVLGFGSARYLPHRGRLAYESF